MLQSLVTQYLHIHGSNGRVERLAMRRDFAQFLYIFKIRSYPEQKCAGIFQRLQELAFDAKVQLRMLRIKRDGLFRARGMV
jgi:hypothetical protein